MPTTLCRHHAGFPPRHRKYEGVRLGRYGWVPWSDAIQAVNRRLKIQVTSEFLASLIFVGMQRTGAKTKQRLEFLLVLDCPKLSDSWERMLIAEESGVTVADPNLSPFPSTDRIGYERLSAIWAVRANHGHSELPGLTLEDTQYEVPYSSINDLPYIFHVTQSSSLMGILRSGLRGMGRLGPMTRMYPTWDPRCQLGQRLNAGHGYDLMLVFDARAVTMAIGAEGGALYFNRVGTLSSSAIITCASTLQQVVVLGHPPIQCPFANRIIFDARFKGLEIVGMAVGDSLQAAKSRRSRFVHECADLDSTQGWLATDLWQCTVCQCFSPFGMLICICCESHCLFKRPGDARAFMPMGHQMMKKGELTVHRITRSRPKRTNLPAPPRGVFYDAAPEIEESSTVAVQDATMGPEEEPPGVSCDTVDAALETIFLGGGYADVRTGRRGSHRSSRTQRGLRRDTRS